MDEVFDRALLEQNLEEHCVNRTSYDRYCPNMREVRHYLVNKGSQAGRTSQEVVLEEAGQFGSKVQINYCTRVLVE